ncbi:unnamed protein product [Nezara viridula]|uniref:Uncharacterized protein n=1 Tax=Nezara viridula TaxID=85310 RepID=A0A9P0EAQ8_NEZVI|nr:unnamed protein product [Nezara viridula]
MKLLHSSRIKYPAKSTTVKYRSNLISYIHNLILGIQYRNFFGLKFKNSMKRLKNTTTTIKPQVPPTSKLNFCSRSTKKSWCEIFRVGVQNDGKNNTLNNSPLVRLEDNEIPQLEFHRAKHEHRPTKPTVAMSLSSSTNNRKSSKLTTGNTHKPRKHFLGMFFGKHKKTTKTTPMYKSSTTIKSEHSTGIKKSKRPAKGKQNRNFFGFKFKNSRSTRKSWCEIFRVGVQNDGKNNTLNNSPLVRLEDNEIPQLEFHHKKGLENNTIWSYLGPEFDSRNLCHRCHKPRIRDPKRLQIYRSMNRAHNDQVEQPFLFFEKNREKNSSEIKSNVSNKNRVMTSQNGDECDVEDFPDNLFNCAKHEHRPTKPTVAMSLSSSTNNRKSSKLTTGNTHKPRKHFLGMFFGKHKKTTKTTPMYKSSTTIKSEHSTGIKKSKRPAKGCEIFRVGVQNDGKNNTLNNSPLVRLEDNEIPQLEFHHKKGLENNTIWSYLGPEFDSRNLCHRCHKPRIRDPKRLQIYRSMNRAHNDQVEQPFLFFEKNREKNSSEIKSNVSNKNRVMTSQNGDECDVEDFPDNLFNCAKHEHRPTKPTVAMSLSSSTNNRKSSKLTTGNTHKPRKHFLGMFFGKHKKTTKTTPMYKSSTTIKSEHSTGIKKSKRPAKGCEIFRVGVQNDGKNNTLNNSPLVRLEDNEIPQLEFHHKKGLENNTIWSYLGPEFDSRNLCHRCHKPRIRDPKRLQIYRSMNRAHNDQVERK